MPQKRHFSHACPILEPGNLCQGRRRQTCHEAGLPVALRGSSQYSHARCLAPLTCAAGKFAGLSPLELGWERRRATGLDTVPTSPGGERENSGGGPGKRRTNHRHPRRERPVPGCGWARGSRGQAGAPESPRCPHLRGVHDLRETAALNHTIK